MELILSGKIKGFVTAAIIHIIGYWLTKAYGAKESKNILLSLLEDVHSLSIPHEIVINALLSGIRDIEDALQYYAAIHHKLDFFISTDKLLKKESNSVLPVYSTKEFLNTFQF